VQGRESQKLVIWSRTRTESQKLGLKVKDEDGKVGNSGYKKDVASTGTVKSKLGWALQGS
jgi:hypothetical protein